MNVRAYNLLVAVLAAVTVTVAMRTVGLLLVSALMIVPVATSQQLARSFRATIAGAVVVGAGAGVGGLLVSAYLSQSYDLTVPPGPAIVLLALACFVATWPLGALLRRRQQRQAPFPDVAPDEHEVSDHPRPRARPRLRPPRGPPRRPRRLRPRRPPARTPRGAL